MNNRLQNIMARVKQERQKPTGVFALLERQAKPQESAFDPVSDKLCPDVWDVNGQLKENVKTFILDKLSKWLDTNKLSMDMVKGVYILGSIAGYQFNKDSDIDVNATIELDQATQDKLQKMLPNGENAPDTQHPVNYFIFPVFRDEWKKTTNGIYNVQKQTWEKKPEQAKETVAGSYTSIVEISRFFLSGFANALNEYDVDVLAYNTLKTYEENAKEENKEDLHAKLRNKVDEIIADINSVYIAKHLMHSLRNEAFEGRALDVNLDIKDMDANVSLNNLIYKFIESMGIFTKVTKVVSERDKWKEIRSKM